MMSSQTSPPPPPGFFKTALLGGLLVVVPAGIAGLVLWKIVSIIRQMILPAAEYLPFGSTVTRLAVVGASLLVVLLGCYFTGLFVRTRFGGKLRGWLERRLLDKIPGYKVIRRIANRYLGDESEKGFRPVLVDLYGAGTLVVGYQIEELPHGLVSVYLPSVPAVTLGQIHLVPAARVTPLEAPMEAVAESLAMYGEGLARLTAGRKEV